MDVFELEAGELSRLPGRTPKRPFFRILVDTFARFARLGNSVSVLEAICFTSSTKQAVLERLDGWQLTEITSDYNLDCASAPFW